jgi:hypothetical protein|tara:strand:+ start:134 stop:604 length:471 start_codon:yes stop_codon:yes gene_type:complete
MIIDVIIDSSTYGNIIKDKPNTIRIVERIAKDQNFRVHNFRVIRDELRRAPNMLPVYDDIVTSTIIDDSNQIRKLADEYFKEYRKLGGGVGKKKIFNDFKIVACATLKNFDLVVSDDERTMKSTKAVQAYKIINIKINRRTPTFHSYSDLKRRYEN